MWQVHPCPKQACTCSEAARSPWNPARRTPSDHMQAASLLQQLATCSLQPCQHMRIVPRLSTIEGFEVFGSCLLYTSPSPRDS